MVSDGLIACYRNVDLQKGDFKIRLVCAPFDLDEWVENHRPRSWSVQDFLSSYSPRDSKPSLSIDFIEQKI